MLYSCLTCYKGSTDESENITLVCNSCSVCCHTIHELVELFLKRGLQCNCASNDNNSICTLISPVQCDSVNQINIDALKNRPDFHNFFGKFCYCDKEYVPEDDGLMLQCIVCEDWFHENCIESKSGKMPDLESFVELICSNCLDMHPRLKGLYESYVMFPEKVVTLDGKCKLNIGSETESSDLPSEKKPKSAALHAFLPENWRNLIVCRCNYCLDFYKESCLDSFILEEEHVYEAESDEELLENLEPEVSFQSKHSCTNAIYFHFSPNRSHELSQWDH